MLLEKSYFGAKIELEFPKVPWIGGGATCTLMCVHACGCSLSACQVPVADNDVLTDLPQVVLTIAT